MESFQFNTTVLGSEVVWVDCTIPIKRHEKKSCVQPEHVCSGPRCHNSPRANKPSINPQLFFTDEGEYRSMCSRCLDYQRERRRRARLKKVRLPCSEPHSLTRTGRCLKDSKKKITGVPFSPSTLIRTLQK